MRRGSWADDYSFLLRHSSDGVIRVATLAALGVPSVTAYRRCQPGGPWRRLLPGILLLSSAPPSRHQLITAAIVYGGHGSLLTGLDACIAHGLRTEHQTHVHVLVPHDRKLRRTEYVTIERTERMPPVSWRNTIPLAPLVRATLDAARRFRTEESVRLLISEAIQRGRCSPGALRDELNVGGQRGSALPRRMLTEVSPDVRSIAESNASALCTRAGLPLPRWNVPLFTSTGEFIAMPDAWFDDVALAWEIDSYEFHFTPASYARTLERNARYTAAGILVIQTLPSRVQRAPREVITELRAAHAAATARPRPPGIATRM